MKNTILVVEDEFQIRQDLELILNLNDYEVISVENGLKALEVLNKISPDLIICDIMMPQMDGFELLEKIQQDNKLINIPFLFLTAKTNIKDLRKGMNLGADDYITKPFNLNELLQAIESKLKKKNRVQKVINDTFEDLRLSIKYSIPHEIRNPLNVILGFSELLKNNFDNLDKTEAIEMLDNIYTSGLRLHNLFERYILLAKLNLIKTSDKDIENLKSNITKNSQKIINEISNNLALEYQRVNDIELDLMDADLLIEEELFLKMIQEIVDNAFKFSKNDTKIKISSKNEKNLHTIEIFNNGIGMKPEQINRIGEYIQFERKFYEQQGIGLGLSIAKNIIEIFNGILKIESEVGQYIKVIIKLPRIN